jgi:hypothetical protein
MNEISSMVAQNIMKLIQQNSESNTTEQRKQYNKTFGNYFFDTGSSESISISVLSASSESSSLSKDIS